MAGSELRRELGYDRPLYMLAFDHCDVFQELFEPEQIPDATIDMDLAGQTFKTGEVWIAPGWVGSTPALLRSSKIACISAVSSAGSATGPLPSPATASKRPAASSLFPGIR
jgi:hypothetical protein